MATHHSRPVKEARFFHPAAERVCLVRCGEGAGRAVLPMLGTDDGEWLCHPAITEGDYQLRYHVSGAWHLEDARIRVERGPEGLHLIVTLDDPSLPWG